MLALEFLNSLWDCKCTCKVQFKFIFGPLNIDVVCEVRLRLFFMPACLRIESCSMVMSYRSFTLSVQSVCCRTHQQPLLKSHGICDQNTSISRWSGTVSVTLDFTQHLFFDLVLQLRNSGTFFKAPHFELLDLFFCLFQHRP